MKTNPTRRASAGVPKARRELTRGDRDAIRSKRRVFRNDQYFQLWKRILVSLTRALGRKRGDEDVARLARLAKALEHAQRQGRPPGLLVKQLTPGNPRGAARKA